MKARRPLRKILDRSAGRSTFGTDAAGYHAGRIGYPEALFDLVFSGLPARPRILEIGAGTGLATEAILARDPIELVIVEPDAALVDYLAGRFAGSRTKLVNSTFPDAQVDGPFDLIVCAAAFHWMEPGAALLFLGSTLHAGGPNRTSLPRRGIIISYCLGWLKPYELPWLAYPPDVARNFGARGLAHRAAHPPDRYVS